ncbi:nuclease-related domain-containing protein [Lysinibacillus pakistanensis]|uniref:Nuclease-related domain-containing protein n=1 Tax=Lysinibacillus pakistanensis TaxID=759811 RepID=A0AAX3X0D8_9BACI|nr:nuclease-related domain-containing protein [Lysinibacillus pakistanensis]MDM5232918.1 nuclease-related domain-containing protein [Lysinibacillus pakistanensis]WHY48411.1 nuclease-related domain-containing protein [Lysinibacillus pakistanensis]WHY53424.1 nuclease-related domain-containing protein [Lysinibacillus pakistanensis]
MLCIYFIEKNYRKSTYYQLTKHHRLLVNAYIPKRNLDELTEIDLLYIDRTGLYVLESKNYSGWIFGNEARQQWTQTMPNRKKNINFALA